MRMFAALWKELMCSRDLPLAVYACVFTLVMRFNTKYYYIKVFVQLAVIGLVVDSDLRHKALDHNLLPGQ